MTDPHLSAEYRSISSSSLFLYGQHVDLPAERMLEVFEKFAVEVGARIHSTSFAVGDGDLKSLKFANLKKRIADRQVKNLSQLVLHSFYDKSDLQSDVFAVGFNNSYGGQYSELMLTQGDESFRHKKLQEFLRASLVHYSPMYGYSVDFSMYYAPSYFAHGM
jgi:hypothetical protein